eukprot:6164383-Prymnesium_polylepis.1
MREFGDSPATALAEQMVEFMSEHGDEIVREDRWKTEVLQAIHSKMRQLEDVQEDLYSLNENVEAMQGQLRTIAKLVALQHAGSIESSKLLRQMGFSADGSDGAAHCAAQRKRKAATAANKLNFRLPGSNKPSAKLEKKMTLKDAVLSAGRLKLALVEEQSVAHPTAAAEAPRAAGESKVKFATCGAADAPAPPPQAAAAAAHAAHPAKAPAPAAPRVAIRVAPAPAPAPTSPTVRLDDGGDAQHDDPQCCQQGKHAVETRGVAAGPVGAGGDTRVEMPPSGVQGGVVGDGAAPNAPHDVFAAAHTEMPGAMPGAMPGYLQPD